MSKTKWIPMPPDDISRLYEMNQSERVASTPSSTLHSWAKVELKKKKRWHLNAMHGGHFV